MKTELFKAMNEKTSQSTKLPLTASILAAVGGSVCCIGPFVLLLMGVSGSWISNLMAFQRYQPVFIVFVLGMLVWAGYKVYKPIESCEPGSVCAVPQIRIRRQILFWFVSAIALCLVTSAYWLPLFLL